MKGVLVPVLLACLLEGHTSVGVSEVKSRCGGKNACLKYDVNSEINSSVYWYDKSSEKCVLLGKRCVQPNVNYTFKKKEACLEACKGEVVVDHKVTEECGDGRKECAEDLPPTSNTTSKSFSPIIAVVCAVGGIALVAILVVSAYLVKKRKKIEKRRYVEDMLHMWSSNSDDSYDSYDDNPEDNNLFDRLERNW